MSRRADELRDGIERAQERRRFCRRLLEQFNAEPLGDEELDARTRRKLEADMQRAENDLEVLGRALLDETA